jgi:hypothetical protein
MADGAQATQNLRILISFIEIYPNGAQPSQRGAAKGADAKRRLTWQPPPS